MDPLLARKRRDIADAIRACLGIWVEAVASEPSAAPGASVKVATMILNRSSRPATLESVSVTYAGAPGEGGALAPNEPLRREISLTLPGDIDTTQPYWLRERPGKGLFTVTDPALVGLPENPPPLVARFTVRVDGSRDPVRGARRLPPHGSGQGRDLPAVRHHAAGDGDVRREGLRVRDRETEEGARHAHERRRRLGRPAPEDGGRVLGVARRGAVRVHGARRGEAGRRSP